jgi:hypothetical protein
MTFHFAKYDNENALRQDLEKQLKIGSATNQDAILFCKINKPSYRGPIEIEQDFLRKGKHEAGIVFSTRASPGIFRLSKWRIFFYFDKDILTEIEVLRFEHSF